MYRSAGGRDSIQRGPRGAGAMTPRPGLGLAGIWGIDVMFIYLCIYIYI